MLYPVEFSVGEAILTSRGAQTVAEIREGEDGDCWEIGYFVDGEMAWEPDYSVTKMEH